jgi:hypothetical protein
MTLVAAMLCGVPCVATGMGAQGEVIGQYGVAIEPGSAPAFLKGVQRVLQQTPEKRALMAQGARKHALQNYVYVRSLQRYLQLYYDLIGRQSLVSQEMPTPEIDASVPVPAKVGATAQTKKPLVTMAELADPDSLEEKVSEHAAVALPKWRLEQEQQRTKREQDLTQQISSQQSNGDVLQVFEAELAKPENHNKAFTERARGVADESEELLSMEAIATPTPGAARPAQGIAPAPVQAIKPAPVQASKPAPVQASKPAPVQAIKPAQPLSIAVAPAPIPVSAPSPVPASAQPQAVVPTLPVAESVPVPEPASVTQPLAALALLETSVDQPVQLGLLGGGETPAPAVADASPQLELLPDDDRKRAAV